MENTQKIKIVTADPSALGLFGLAIITLVASSQKLGITSGVALVFPWAIFLGATAQLFACINDFNIKNPHKKIPSVTVITDVVDSLEWIFKTTDMYFVPSHEIKNRYVQKGMAPEIFRVTGVPVSSKFICDKKIKSDKLKVLCIG